MFTLCFLFVLIFNVHTFVHFNNNTFIEQLSSKYFYTFVKPKFIPEPYLICLNDELIERLSISTINDSRHMAELLSGNRLFSGSQPIAMTYAGHQFGDFTAKLGDGRAVLLGQLNQWAFHAKGTGPNVYSRAGDGRAVLRSSIREYLMSESMFHLGIATTRALSLVGSTFLPVYRESIETAAIVVRVAPIVAFVRIGTFEYFAFRHQNEQVRQLADFVIRNMYEQPLTGKHRYRSLLIDIIHRTAYLVAQWQAIGFAHGVLNTDNMNVLGSTIDYGPFGFVEDQLHNYVPNHSDDQGRYAFDRQASIAAWNLGKLRSAFETLLEPNDMIDEHFEFWSSFNRVYDRFMREKLGLIFYRRSDQWIYEEILRLLIRYRIDYTRFWRDLADNRLPERIRAEHWYTVYRQRLEAEGSYAAQVRRTRMNRVNPKYILRNYMAQIAIEKAQQGDFNEIHRLVQLLRYPYDDQPDNDNYAKLSPAWAKKLIISCSS
jgi:serine/tyrosine/threonine adenylyltransferase